MRPRFGMVLFLLFLILSTACGASEPAPKPTPTVPSPPTAAPTAEPTVQPTPTTEPTPELKLIEFESETGRFRILMPGQPTETMQQADSVVGPLDAHLFMVEEETGAYMFGYNDYPITTLDDVDIDAMFEGYLEGALEPMGGKLTSQESISYGDYPGIEFRATIPESVVPGGGFARGRVYLVGARLFQYLILNQSNDVVESAQSTEMLDSFEVTDLAAIPLAVTEAAAPTAEPTLPPDVAQEDIALPAGSTVRRTLTLEPNETVTNLFLATEGAVFLATMDAAAGLDVDMALYTLNGEEQLAEASTQNGADTIAFNEFGSDFFYRLEVTEMSGTGGELELRLIGTRNVGFTLTPDAFFLGRLDGSDELTYLFSGSAGETLKLLIIPDPDTPDIDLNVAVVSIDDLDAVLYEGDNTAAGGTEEVAFEIPEDGLYFITVAEGAGIAGRFILAASTE